MKVVYMLISILLLVLLVFVIILSIWSRNVEKPVRYPTCASENISESKARGAFLFEYVPDSITIYDSIKIVVKEAFAEHRCFIKSDSICWNNNLNHVVVVFDDKDNWPLFKINPYYVSEENYNQYYPVDSINWSVDAKFSSKLNRNIDGKYNSKFVKRIFWEEARDSIIPDEYSFYIEQITLCSSKAEDADSLSSRSMIKKDTIGSFRLLKTIVR